MRMRPEEGVIVWHARAARRTQGVDAFTVLVGERHVDAAEIVLELRHRARADDGAGDPGLVHTPRQSELAEVAALFIGEL